MTCDRFSAQDAERWGFVNHVFPDAKLLSEARALAKKLLAKDAMSLAIVKTTASAIARQMAPSEATQSDREMLLLADLLARRRGN